MPNRPGGYPTASTFKAITALAALDDKLIGASTPVDDAGCVQVYEQRAEAQRRFMEGEELC